MYLFLQMMRHIQQKLDDKMPCPINLDEIQPKKYTAKSKEKLPNYSIVLPFSLPQVLSVLV